MVRGAPVGDEASEAAVSVLGPRCSTGGRNSAQLPPGVRSAPWSQA